MTPDAARSALAAVFARIASSTVEVTWDGSSYPVRASAIDASLDVTASIDAAMAVGRTGGPLDVVRDRVIATILGTTVALRVSADPTATAAALDPIATAIEKPPVDAAVSVKGTDVLVSPASAGRKLDRAAMLDRILVALVGDGLPVEAVVVEAPPTISDAEAKRAAETARSLISAPVVVTFESRSVEVPVASIAEWIVFTQSGSDGASAPIGSDGTLAVSFDATAMAPIVASLSAGRTTVAKDASFVAEKGSVRIVPSQVGRGPDLRKLAADLASACLPGGSRSAALTLAETQPSLTTAAAKEMGIANRISTFTTSYSTSNPARTNNVHLLAAAFDGKLVAPGATFSFNGSAGQRTAAKGYQEAPAIVNGKLVPQLGGGVCQVGTTFFNTVFFSGLPIVERHNHSFYISHYPKGRDATVSWGGPDFKFKNDTPNWILIRTATTASTLTIALYGTDPGYRVEYTTGEFTDLVPHGVTEVKDSKLAKGVRVVEDGGVDGRSIVVKRTVYKGGTVVRVDTFSSHYSPKEEIVRVGTRPGSTTPTETPTP
jgi:vancomycin resistance protein YoaR